MLQARWLIWAGLLAFARSAIATEVSDARSDAGFTLRVGLDAAYRFELKYLDGRC